MKENATNSDFWDISQRPDLVQRMHAIAIDSQTVFKHLEDSEPVNPETGEKGKFCHYTGSFPRFIAVYKTPSGRKFTV